MTNSYPIYPEVVVELSGHDGNAHAIIGRVRSALRASGVSNEQIKAYQEESMSGDYDHLLATAQKWVTVQ